MALMPVTEWQWLLPSLFLMMPEDALQSQQTLSHDGIDDFGGNAEPSMSGHAKKSSPYVRP